MGTIDYSPANTNFEKLQVIDSTEINLVLFQHPSNIQMYEMHQIGNGQYYAIGFFKMLDPSEFDKYGNSLAGFQWDMTRLSV